MCSSRFALSRNDGNLAIVHTAVISEWCVQWLNRWKTKLSSRTYWLLAFWNKIGQCEVCVCVQNLCCSFWLRIKLRLIRWLLLHCLNDWCRNQTSYPRLLLGMNLGSLSMILRWNIGLPNRTQNHHLARRICGSQNLSRRSCWLLFSTAWVWCTTNLSV